MVNTRHAIDLAGPGHITCHVRYLTENLSQRFMENIMAKSSLVDALAHELERPRELSARVLNYIGGTYGVDQDAIGSFLTNEMGKLEDYELDLILSPVFTPKI